MISIIAAIGKNNELGKDNNLIWHLPGDLKFFKTVTTGKTIIMGRKTFESLPKMLPNRKHIIISHSKNFPKEVEVFDSIDKFLEKYKSENDEIFVIGGASIYKEFLSYADKMYITKVDAECKEADAYFPSFDEDDYIRETIGNNIDNGISYTHYSYIKK